MNEMTQKVHATVKKYIMAPNITNIENMEIAKPKKIARNLFGIQSADDKRYLDELAKTAEKANKDDFRDKYGFDVDREEFISPENEHENEENSSFEGFPLKRKENLITRFGPASVIKFNERVKKFRKSPYQRPENNNVEGEFYLFTIFFFKYI